MLVHLHCKWQPTRLDVHPGELLRSALRRLRYYSVKHGDDTGDTGADAVLLTFTPDQPRSYRLVNRRNAALSRLTARRSSPPRG